MQQDSATTRSIEGRDGPAVTVGLDVGDRYTHVHVLGAGGEVLRERRVRTAAAALGTALTGLPPSRVVLDAGPRSPWLSRVVAELGHEVVVANPRQVALIARSQRKTDRLDASTPRGWRGWGASTPNCSPRSATAASRASMTSC